MSKRILPFSLLVICGGLVLVCRIFFTSDSSVPDSVTPDADKVVAGALDRLSEEESAKDWQLKTWQEEAWATFKEDGLSWTAPPWFIESMEKSTDKRKAMRDAALRLYPEPRGE